MNTVAVKPCCKHRDERTIDMQKKSRLQTAIQALKNEGRISSDAFFSKFVKALSKRKKR